MDLRGWQDHWAENLKDATEQAVINACSDGRGQPDAAVVANVLKSFEVYNADAAADEQLAGSLLRGQSYNGLNYCKALLPNIKVLHRDKTHAARRLCSRGWKADAYLSSVPWGQSHTEIKQHPLQLKHILLNVCCCCCLLFLLLFALVSPLPTALLLHLRSLLFPQVFNSVCGKGSFIQRIQHSDTLKNVFHEHAKHLNFEIVDGSRVKDLKASAHRFEVSQRPFVRKVLFYEATVGTAMAIASGRRGDQAVEIGGGPRGKGEGAGLLRRQQDFSEALPPSGKFPLPSLRTESTSPNA